MPPTITMAEHWVGSSLHTHVWQGSILYVFYGSMDGARRRAAFYPLIHGPDVAALPVRALSVVWMDETPYVFPGALTAASERGKMHKRIMKRASSTALYHRRMEAAGFEEKYGGGIGGPASSPRDWE